MARDVAAALSPCRTQLDDRAAAHRIGLVVLATDHTTERDFARLMDPAQIGVYANRIDYENPTTLENLRLTGPRLTAAAEQILPGESLDVLVYSCTAASVVLGNEAVARRLRAAKPGAACVTPSSAAFDAFAALGIRRVSVLTPYSSGVTAALLPSSRDHSRGHEGGPDIRPLKKRARTMSTEITLQNVTDARERIRGRVRETMLVSSPALSELSGGEVYLKLEQMQITGSFKLRGATNAVLSLSDAQKAKGIVAVSTGNHGRGLAYAAAQAGLRCIVAMSELVPQNKVEGIKAQGAEVRIVGRSQDDAQAEVDKLVGQGMVMLPPFDHPDVIAGQGTLGLELLEQMPDVETVLVPLSGGGLISGMALALKAANPNIRVIGVSMERGAAMYESQQAGKPVVVEELPTLADSLGGGVGLDNAYTFAMVRDLVDELVLVNEAEIAAAIRHAYWQERQVIEGSGSVGIAALLAGKIRAPGKCVALVSGRNIDMTLHHRIISGEDVKVETEA